MTPIQILINAANKIHSDDPVLAQVAVTQAILESNYLVKPSLLASKYHNLFGIKGKGDAGSVSLLTTEYVRGRAVKIYQDFAVNKDLTSSFAQHAKILGLPRYSSVRGAKSPTEAFRGLLAGGYATDPKYPQKLTAIWEKYVKQHYESA